MSPNSEIICLETAPPSKTQPEATFNRRAFLSRHKVLFSASCSFLVIICLLLAFNGQAFIEPGKSHAANDSDNHEEVCQRPNLRLEWRSLDKVQQHDYIQAVKCLKTIVSHLQLNQTLYDDFPWVHKKFGEYSHDAAPFFAWHRYFIHTYERILQSHCDYQGSLPYWDWTLDWENITLSPIWDTETGFGGTGNASTGNPIFKAYCVTEGPFANLEIPYFEDIYQPHCLLRGFDANLEDFRTELRPQALMKLLLSLDYETFNLGLENGPHIAIPKSINGDFSLHTAPFDPVFFLHHAQLDRMWWRWQQMSPAKRMIEYLGKSSTDSLDRAYLTDILPMGGLGPDVKVHQIMNTESGLLCYRY